ncbi:MAG: enoyl-CoA hydratase/isomerase family protein [Rhodobacteraceae bacterium]|jgi:enoyl-CoA hydratase/carnithine racemase|nr:enoyl-CoA hydratase/isomerase family protein [Paracoccaceae bacterium]
MAGTSTDWEAPGLRVERLDAVVRLTIDRPGAMNAFSPGLVRALNAALAAIADDCGVRAVIVTGAGRAFCCGADLKFLAAHGPDSPETVAFLRELNRFIDDLDTLDRPVIGVANGLVMGGGLETLLCCDIVMAGADVTIRDPHITIGAIHGAGGSQRLARCVGLQRALDLVLSARSLTAAEAALWGIVTRVSHPSALQDDALALAQEIAARDPAVASGLKRLVRLSLRADLTAGLTAERAAYRAAARMPAFATAMAGFASRSARKT